MTEMTEEQRRRVVQYRGYTITKAFVFDGTQWVANGWDACGPEGTDIYQAFHTLREAKAWVKRG